MSSRPVFDGYHEHFKDERLRHNDKEALIHFFNSEQIKEEIGLSSIKSMLSVGVGFGNIDMAIMRDCPKLKEYTAIEPDSGFHTELKATMATFTSVKKEFIMSRFEDYQGPPEYFDAVFFIHSPNYLDCLEVSLQRGYEMVKKGGKLIVVVSMKMPYYEVCEKVCGTVDNKSIDCKAVVREIDDQFKEFTVENHYDFSEPGPMNYSFIDVTFRRKATPGEKEQVMEGLSKYFVPGTKIVKSADSVFILSKN